MEEIKENQELALIPEEIKQINLQLSEEKRGEINKILSQMFVGTSDLQKKVDAIVVKDHTDEMAMQMADAARKNIKRMRLDGVELFNQKRDAVQMQKLQYDTEDKLWLKAKQMYEISLKAIEEVAAYKADTLKRYQLEQKEKMIQARLEAITIYDESVNRFQIENLTDQMFDTLLAASKKAYDDRIEAARMEEELRLENERILEQRRNRELILLQIDGVKRNSNMTFTLENKENNDFSNIIDVKDILDCEEKQFQAYLEEFNCTAQCNVEYENKLKLENQRLQELAELEAKRNKELRLYITFIRDYDKMLHLPEEEYQKELEEVKKAAQLQWEFERDEAARKQKEQEEAELKAKQLAEENEKIALQLKKKQEEEEAAEAKRIADEKLAKELTEQLAKAPIKEQLIAWIDTFSISECPEILKDNVVSEEIQTKFKMFVAWSKTQVDKF